MITYSEKNAVKLSATKKDFYQIWNELLDTASKLSERWDPTSTNESDPGIVLLKVLTAVADKLNYNVDVNTLEAFMPSAAQEESMRKLTEMLGYNMKYYRSAETDVQISYNKPESEPIDPDIEVCIDKFTNIKDIDDTVNFITLKAVYLNTNTTSKLVPCIEGELVECETDDDNIISLLQLDDNNRYYLPEVQIAENGIFVTNIVEDSQQEADDWTKVDNLNVQPVGKTCYKFGFDSKVNLPYIQFPDDISNIIGDGLKIKYVRTNGVNGNISPKTLYKMEKPVSWQVGETEENQDVAYLDTENYTVYNPAATANGANIESLTDAYNNYKKTIGTFDTLVTCRDYMNKIYNLTAGENSTTPLVSNIIVSDIRDDINKAVTLCTFDKYGIEYRNIANEVGELIEKNTSEWASFTADNTTLNKIYKVVDNSNMLNPIIQGYFIGSFDGTNYYFSPVDPSNLTKLSNFDLVFYPFRNTYGLNTKTEFVKSFKYDSTNLIEIENAIEENKTLSHNIVSPNDSDIACIKNYYKLSARITTTRKVNTIEQKNILNNVYSALYKHFNMRKIDFGEEIPYDSILEVMEKADPRIKNVSLDDPALETKFCTVGGGEFGFASESTVALGDEYLAGNVYYNKLVLNNVLAGRIPLFNYDENFKPEYNERYYPKWKNSTTNELESYDLLYPSLINETKTNGIKVIDTEFEVTDPHNVLGLTLKENEVIQFRLPNLKTVKTYPAYVNYYLQLNTRAGSQPAIPATMTSLFNFLSSTSDNITSPHTWTDAINNPSLSNCIQSTTITVSGIDNQPALFADSVKATAVNTFNALLNKRYALFVRNGEQGGYSYTQVTSWSPSADGTYDFYYLVLTAETLSYWISWIITLQYNTTETLDGLYYNLGLDLTKNCGELVDKVHNRYLKVTGWRSEADPFKKYFVQETHEQTVRDTSNFENSYTANGLGQNASIVGIGKDEEYQLKSDEYLLVTYTSATSTEGDAQTVINEVIRPTTDSNGITTYPIIKPNFDLKPSAEYRAEHNFNKTTGYDFSQYTGIEQPKGMFTLGTSEQIELREFVTVELDQDYTNLYWERNDEDQHTQGDQIVFTFNEEPINRTTGAPITSSLVGLAENIDFIYSSYILKEGEYLYYTDRNKTDIAYYGAGTKITRGISTPLIYKSKYDSIISTEDIATYGLSAAIPWRPYTLGKTNSKLTIKEYKYINLAAGSVLDSIDIQESNITNKWIPCTTAVYKLSGEDGWKTLDPVTFVNSNTTWEVRSKLELNMGPTHGQKLYQTEKAIDRIILHFADVEAEDKVLEPHNNIPLSIKANKLLQSTADSVNVGTIDLSNAGTSLTYYDCQLKIFEEQDIRDVSNNPLNLNNFAEGGFTKLAFSQDKLKQTGKPFISLGIVIPDGHFGLIMMQNNKIGNSVTNAAIRLVSEETDEQTNIVPTIYNNTGSGWWSDKIYTSNAYAVEGTAYLGLNYDTFTALKERGILYTKEVLNEAPATTSYKYYSYSYNGSGKQWVHYIPVAADAVVEPTDYNNGTGTYNKNTYFYQLVDIGSDNDSNFYQLRNGINIIKITRSCTLEIFPDGSNKDIVIFSNLDLVKTNTPINPKLKYKITNNNYTSVEDQILADIKKIDPTNKFYYNAIMNNETALDLNELDEKDTLENPLTLYNYNNINNKFVISEIDADYLPTGVVIARNSKL